MEAEHAIESLGHGLVGNERCQACPRRFRQGCNVEAMDRVYAEDGVYDVRDFRYMDGLAAIREMMNGEGHRSLTGGGAAHIGAPPRLELDGDRAIATNHTVVVGRREGQFVVLRLCISRIYLSRRPEGWRIDRRIIDPLDGRESARALAARVFEGPSEDPGARADSHSLAPRQAGA